MLSCMFHTGLAGLAGLGGLGGIAGLKGLLGLALLLKKIGLIPLLLLSLPVLLPLLLLKFGLLLFLLLLIPIPVINVPGGRSGRDILTDPNFSVQVCYHTP